MNTTHHTFIKSYLFVFALLLLFCGVAHAEGNCPEGYYPIGGESGQGGPQGCAPIPGYNQPPPARWVDQWGAIAVDGQLGKVGAVTSMPSENQAKQAAMADCRSQGGTQCVFQLAYYNQCGVLTVGDTKLNANSAGTIEQAARAGMKTCSAATKNCRTYYTACSLPKRIQ